MRDDLIANLQPPVEVVDDDLLDDIYLALSADSPDDWKAPEEWGNSLDNQPERASVRFALRSKTGR